MVEINKIKDTYDYYVFTIQTDDGIFEISFQNNLDLYWRYIWDYVDEGDTKEFIITKENYYFYSLIEELYDSIKNYQSFGKDNESFDDIKKYDQYNPYGLFKEGAIDWHSDDAIYDTASRLVIKKEMDFYKIIFVKGIIDYDMETYVVRFSNSGSRYSPFNVNFMKFYYELGKYEPDYHQIHIEEYLYNKRCKCLRKEK